MGVPVAVAVVLGLGEVPNFQRVWEPGVQQLLQGPTAICACQHRESWQDSITRVIWLCSIS